MSDQRAAPAWRLETCLVHAGERAGAPRATPTATPIYTATAYLYPSLDELDAAFASGEGYLYTRYGSPTVAALAAAVAAAEGGRGAVAYGSGMAALHAALLAAATPRGETAPRPRAILAARDLYGSSTVLLDELFAPRGASVVYADLCDLAAAEAALAAHSPEVVLVESISNPLLRVADIAALAALCRAAGARLVVDSTLATPVLQRPLALGADLVVHSATKYLGGHGDCAGGVVAARTGLLLDTLARQARLLGASLGPFEAQQLLRGLKTLSLRVERQCQSAATVARFLAGHPAVARVHYPGLPDHPGHALAAQALGGRFGGLVSFELARGDAPAVAAFVNRLGLFLPATTLGDIYSLVMVPAMASHRELSPAQRAERAIGDGLVRLSVGIEAADDLVADLAAALEG
ncbi:MAG TPA: PLP-dependent aspartate aminotransferase family protein [Chloroflexaceae bacterium]|nr:PLP-dependent aspartate aminotransferase family protein [Chloroflexaceae bacterium]